MRSVLQDIQDTVIQYAGIIAQVIKVEVEIVDVNLLRIAALVFMRIRLMKASRPKGKSIAMFLLRATRSLLKTPENASFV